MDKKYLIIAGVVGFLGVAFGAFGAHGLKNILTLQMIVTYKTGILYHLIHSAVLLALALSNKPIFTKAFLAILIGIILFSFSLYIYSITQIKFLVFITPIGGLSLILGWLLIIVEGIKQK